MTLVILVAAGIVAGFVGALLFILLLLGEL